MGTANCQSLGCSNKEVGLWIGIGQDKIMALGVKNACWLSACRVAELYVVEQQALERYARRGAVSARWDDSQALWLYDVRAVARLFLHKDAASPALGAENMGVLGSVTLGGTRRKAPSSVRETGVYTRSKRKLNVA